MKNNPFVKNFDTLLNNIKVDVESGETSFYLASEDDDSEFSKLLVQPLHRNINGKEFTFFAIRDIQLKEELRGKGSLKKFLTELEGLGINLMFHDVLNQKLYNFLVGQGYSIFKEIKYEDEMISCYKLKEQ